MQQRSIGNAIGRPSSGVLVSGERHLTVDVVRTGSSITIYVAGELDIAGRDPVLTTVEQNLAGRRHLKTMRVDVTAVTFIDSAGLRSLTQACEMARQRDLVFYLMVARSGPIGDFLVLAEMKNWFKAHSGARMKEQPARTRSAN
jgi:anti-anti-sigma factor